MTEGNEGGIVIRGRKPWRADRLRIGQQVRLEEPIAGLWTVRAIERGTPRLRRIAADVNPAAVAREWAPETQEPQSRYLLARLDKRLERVDDEAEWHSELEVLTAWTGVNPVARGVSRIADVILDVFDGAATPAGWEPAPEPEDSSAARFRNLDLGDEPVHEPLEEGTDASAERFRNLDLSDGEEDSQAADEEPSLAPQEPAGETISEDAGEDTPTDDEPAEALSEPEDERWVHAGRREAPVDETDEDGEYPTEVVEYGPEIPVACPRCGATGDDPCTTAAGKRLKRSKWHAGRHA